MRVCDEVANTTIAILWQFQRSLGSRFEDTVWARQAVRVPMAGRAESSRSISSGARRAIASVRVAQVAPTTPLVKNVETMAVMGASRPPTSPTRTRIGTRVATPAPHTAIIGMFSVASVLRRPAIATDVAKTAPVIAPRVA